jgi:hypothetical protein
MTNIITLDADAVHILHMIAGGLRHENTLRQYLQDDAEGREILARDLRAPGRQIDELQRRGLIEVDDNEAITVADIVKSLIIIVE